MADELNIIPQKLTETITQLCEVSWMFVKKPNEILPVKENSASIKLF